MHIPGFHLFEERAALKNHNDQALCNKSFSYKMKMTKGEEVRRLMITTHYFLTTDT